MSQALPALPSARLDSLDVYRGFVMFLMAAELLDVPGVAKHFPDNMLWQLAARHTQHVEWTGCSLHDLIQPSFTFMVGAALPFSIASRVARGHSKALLWLHAVWRALLLVLLGVFLRSIGEPMTYWTFEDTLSQIGLGYPLLFLLGFASTRVSWAALAVVLIGYWLAFGLFPLPPSDFNYTAANVPTDWPWHFQGFAAHWNMNSNAAWAFDLWFLNLFPRAVRFVGNDGGYSTLSFIPTLGTMILGLIGGSWIRQAFANNPRQSNEAASPQTPAALGDLAMSTVATRLITAGLACLAAGWALHAVGICPAVKKLWTPSWTLYSGGWCFLLMAVFYVLVDMQGWKAWTFPLVVIGRNSIAAYVLVHTIVDFIGEALHTHLGKGPFLIGGEAFEPMLHGGTVLLVIWLILLWMHQRKLWLRV
ncbi:MAG: acyltransferase family protein [Roseimicrobium sp.]